MKRLIRRGAGRPRENATRVLSATGHTCSRRLRLFVAVGVALVAATWTAKLRAAEPAVVAGDAPLTISQTMQHDAALAAVSFVDAEQGWAVGERGVIWHTADGGATWRLQASGTTCGLRSVTFVDRQRGWAAGGAMQPYAAGTRGVLLRTVDGGATWSEVDDTNLPLIERVKFFDAAHGIAVGAANAIYHSGVFTTQDGGKVWQPLPADAHAAWLAADFLDTDTGAFAGRGGRTGTLMRRRVVEAPPVGPSSRAYRALVLTAPTEGWLVGDGALVMQTHDLGASWQTPPGELPPLVREHFDFAAIAVHGEKIWLAGAPGSRILHSADGGRSWQLQATGICTPLRAICFVDEQLGFAVGELGAILATGDGGRTWQIQRRGGQRAALVVALAGEHDLSLELLGQFGAEQGYLTAVSLLRPLADDNDTRLREAALLAGATAASVAWQFPLAADDQRLSPADLLATLNRANDGRAIQRLEAHLVRELRMWRPEVVVTHHVAASDAYPLGSVVEQMVAQALQAAADPNRYTDLAAEAGLEPWQVKKVYGQVPAGWRGEQRITTGQFAPRLGATLADWAEPARRLIEARVADAPPAIELDLVTAAADIENRDSTNLFAGVRLVPGGDARRRLANLPSDDVEQLRKLAALRRQIRMLIERSAGNAAWAAQISHLTDDLDPATAGELLFELADGYRAAGKLDLAADTYTTLARRWPEHPLVEPALCWLVQFYASSECAQRLADRNATNYRRPPDAAAAGAGSVQQASAVQQLKQQVDAAPVIGLPRDSRLERATALGKYLESARPAMYAEPTIRFPLVVAQRQLGYANPAQRYFLSLRSLSDSDPWRRCGATEEWFLKANDQPPPKKLGNCRRAAQRPHLDGKLDEPLWQTADPLTLRTVALASGGEPAPEQLVAATVRIVHDGEFLYLSAECPKAAAIDYRDDVRPRPRDADLAAHDRLLVRLDIDRDYTTAYELAIDDRGWTCDACWNDTTWNPRWFIAAAASETMWTVEAAIPLAELAAAAPTARDVWALSLVRTIPRGGEESWSGERTAADSPERFGLLIFE